MVGGFNTNVRYKGRTFHVQTEDSGKANPLIHTLLYEGGVILYSKKHSYREEFPDDTREAEVRTLMEQQHRGVLQSLKSGDLDDEIVVGSKAKGKKGKKGKTAGESFGSGIITDRPLADLILEHFSSD